MSTDSADESRRDCRYAYSDDFAVTLLSRELAAEPKQSPPDWTCATAFPPGAYRGEGESLRKKPFRHINTKTSNLAKAWELWLGTEVVVENV